MVSSITPVNPIIQQDWKAININEKLNLQAPGLQYTMNTGKDGGQIPAASMSYQEALYGKPPEESHFFRNTLIGAVILLGGGFLVAKYGKGSLKDGKLKDFAKKYETFWNNLGIRVKGWFSKKPEETKLIEHKK